ncbi:hypothetical protein POF50_023440 [Streptomyces sp. SL13]|uniref:DUF3558 domain-containing protein n=1 Tax=Streptantibioticus silvisoli TaxID=2705255 RepID=A0AA90KAC9_9ACTN|nr:hypothetical protein [Streptantibioticus silvisoli]MDI5972253.1 hypothetical protein [Streptantibioticus silvisoli]
MTALARTTARTTTGRALAALLSAAVLTGVAGCSASSSGDDGAGDPGVTDQSGTVTAAPPGKYQTLPEPCGSVSRTTLTSILPKASGYAGTPALTYDTDRRVGCKWDGTANGAARALVIDIERVVSYNPAVSDDDKAHQDFAQQATAAHVPAGEPVPNVVLGTPQPGTSSPPAAHTAGGASKRRISGLGDEAFLNDSVKRNPGGSGIDVTFVFRTANVLVTVDLSQPASGAADADLQLGADQVAQELAKSINQ